MQYAYWIRDLVSGELKSFKDSQPVLGKIWRRFLNSLPLFICATLLVWTLAFPTGIQAAIHRGAVYDRTTTFAAYTLISVPGFFLSYIVILWVVDLFGVPVIGLKTFGMELAPPLSQVMDRIWHLVIPSLMSALGGMAILSRYVRSQMLEVVGAGLRTNGEGEGCYGGRRHLPARAAQRVVAVCDPVRVFAARADRRLGHFRANFRVARGWAG